jgi:hypothetical protein
LLTLKSTVDAGIHIQADSDNSGEGDNPYLSMSQDGSTAAQFKMGLIGNAGDEFTNSLANASYIHADNDASQPLMLAHDNALVMSIRSGKVGVGTSNPTTQLQATDDISCYHGSSEWVTIRGLSGGQYIQYGSGGDLSFVAIDTFPNSGASERVRIKGSGGITFNGDTAAANALDDYEEGTWNPSLIGSTGSAGSWAESSWTALYTKIGNRVYFHASGYVTNKGSYTGKTKLTGLPFLNGGSTTAVSIGMFPDSSYPDSRMVVAHVEWNSTQVGFYDSAKADAEHDWSDLVTGYYCNVGGQYQV